MGASSSTLTCDAHLFEKDLSGQVYVITGGNSGIGLTTAGQLAKQGATVVIACRRIDAGEAAAARLNEAAANGGNVEAMALDLADLSSVRAFASAFTSKYSSLNCLVNNAGIMNTSADAKTKDGFDAQFGTNHLGHFLLTNLLTPTLQASAPSRVVVLSSCYHDDAQGRKGHIDFEDLNFEHRKYDGWMAYSQSKLANLLHAKELARRLESSGVTAYSVHPGFVRSNLINNTLQSSVLRGIARPFLSYGARMIEPWEGAATSLHTILSDVGELENGGYYAQNGSPRGLVGGWPQVPPNAEARDDAVAKRLWEESERLVEGRTTETTNVN